MELDSLVQDIVAAWRSVVKEYSERPENRMAIEAIAFEHWTLFWRLLVSCVPSEEDDHELWRALNAWKKSERDDVLETLKATHKDEKQAWKMFSSLLAQARGHAQCAIPPKGEDGVQGRAKCDTLPCPSSEGSARDTIACDVDREVLDMLENGDPCESLCVDKPLGGRPRIRLASAMPAIPPLPPLPATSYFRLKEGAGETDLGFVEQEATTLARNGR